MAISLTSLRNASQRYAGSRYLSFSEAKARGARTGFLSHSRRDVDLARGLVQQLRESGLDLYVDWEDQQMPDIPDRTTAARIQQAIVASEYFLFLATPNSTTSRWCPWEIGYADGRKPIEKILIVPTTDGSGTYYGNEYLQLYRHVDTPRYGTSLEFAEPGRSLGLSVSRL